MANYIYGPNFNSSYDLTSEEYDMYKNYVDKRLIQDFGVTEYNLRIFKKYHLAVYHTLFGDFTKLSNSEDNLRRFGNEEYHKDIIKDKELITEKLKMYNVIDGDRFSPPLKYKNSIRNKSRSKAKSPVKSRTRSKAKSPVKSRTKVKSPVKSRTRTKVKSPVKSRTRTKVKSPVKSRTRTKAKSPVKSRTRTKVKSPVKSRTRTKVKSPVK